MVTLKSLLPPYFDAALFSHSLKFQPVSPLPLSLHRFAGSRLWWEQADSRVARKAIKSFDETRPWDIVEPLVLARKALKNLKDKHWAEVKQKEIDELVVSLTGLYLSLNSDEKDYYSSPVSPYFICV